MDEPTASSALALDDPGAADVLIVDDESFNRELLREILETYGYRVREAQDGREALLRVSEALPDVVLLDVMMPGIDGLEVCRRLKSAKETAHVPVLLVTALSERHDRIQGIDDGADDFLNKPVDRHELKLRVRNAVYRKRLYDDLALKYGRLRDLEGMRESLTQMLVHDMRSPLTTISANLELLEMSLGDQMSQEAEQDLREARTGVGMLMELIDQILETAKAQEAGMGLEVKEVDLRSLVERSLSGLDALVGEHHLDVVLPERPIILCCDPDLIRRTLVNLVGNALKFTEAGSRIRVRGEEDGPAIRIEVEDDGPGIHPDLHETLFERFTHAIPEGQERPVQSTGLGLSFCRMAVEAHGGQVGVESRPGEGSRFWVVLPRQPDSAFSQERGGAPRARTRV